MTASAEKQINLKSLLETGDYNAEHFAARRGTLETMRRDRLEAEMRTAAVSLHNQVRKDPRAILTSDPKFERQNWQITLPLSEQDGSITVQSAKLHYVPTPDIRIYTGKASAALEANPEEDRNLEPAQVMHGSLRGSSRGNDSSLRELQADIEDILLLELLSEQLAPVSSGNSIAQVGETAVHAG